MMKPTILEGKGIRAGVRFAALIVPDTDGLLAVDERSPANQEDFEEPKADWRITHIPSMFAVRKDDFTDAASLEQAVAIAQAFYREATELGWNLSSEDPKDLTEKHNAMPEEVRREMWKRIRAAGAAVGKE